MFTLPLCKKGGWFFLSMLKFLLEYLLEMSLSQANETNKLSLVNTAPSQMLFLCSEQILYSSTAYEKEFFLIFLVPFLNQGGEAYLFVGGCYWWKWLDPSNKVCEHEKLFLSLFPLLAYIVRGSKSITMNCFCSMKSNSHKLPFTKPEKKRKM